MVSFIFTEPSPLSKNPIRPQDDGAPVPCLVDDGGNIRDGLLGGLEEVRDGPPTTRPTTTWNITSIVTERMDGLPGILMDWELLFIQDDDC